MTERQKDVSEKRNMLAKVRTDEKEEETEKLKIEADLYFFKKREEDRKEGDGHRHQISTQ